MKVTKTLCDCCGADAVVTMSVAALPIPKFPRSYDLCDECAAPLSAIHRRVDERARSQIVPAEEAADLADALLARLRSIGGAQ
jgi:hypothetical protein